MANTLDYTRRSTAAKPRSPRRQAMVRAAALDTMGLTQALNAEVEDIKKLWHVDADGNLCTSLNLRVGGTISIPKEGGDVSTPEGWVTVSGEDFKKDV